MKTSILTQKLFCGLILCLFIIPNSWAQEYETLANGNCGKVPCFTKSAKKTIGSPIMPPDFPFSIMISTSNVNQAGGNLGNLGAEFRLGIAPKKQYQIKHSIVADEQFARQNNLDNNVLHQEVLVIDNAKMPYFEVGARLTNLNFENLNRIGNRGSFQLQYIDIIPVAMRYDLGQRFSLGVGTSFSVLANASLDGREISGTAREGFNRWEPGLMFNLQFGKRGRGLQAGITYNQRFSYLNETSLRYGITQFSIGWGFGGSK